MIAALAFVPPSDLEVAPSELAAYLPEELKPVLKYFEKYYIGKLLHLLSDGSIIRKNPLFLVGTWSVYERPFDTGVSASSALAPNFTARNHFGIELVGVELSVCARGRVAASIGLHWTVFQFSGFRRACVLLLSVFSKLHSPHFVVRVRTTPRSSQLARPSVSFWVRRRFRSVRNSLISMERTVSLPSFLAFGTAILAIATSYVVTSKMPNFL